MKLNVSKFLLVSTMLFTFASCNESPQVQTSYIVLWKNYDGTILEVDENQQKGTIPTYDGPTPTRESIASTTYTFKGWDKKIESINSNQVYTAQFDSAIREYSVTVDYNDGVTETKTFKTNYGNKIDKIDDPKRDGYRFDGWYNGDHLWDFDNDVVKTDTVLKATYSLIKITSGSMLPDLTIRSGETITVTMDAAGGEKSKVFYSGTIGTGYDKVSASATMYNGTSLVGTYDSFDFAKGTPITVRPNNLGTFATGNKLEIKITNSGDKNVVLKKALCCESDDTGEDYSGALTRDVTVPVKYKNKIFCYFRNCYTFGRFYNYFSCKIIDQEKCLDGVIYVAGGTYDASFTNAKLRNFKYDSNDKKWKTPETFYGEGCVAYTVQIGDISADKNITIAAGTP